LKHSNAQMRGLAIGDTATYQSRQSSLTVQARCVHGRRCKAEAAGDAAHRVLPLVQHGVRMMARWRQRPVWGRGRQRPGARVTAAKLQAHGSCTWPHSRTPTAHSASDSFLRIDIDIPAVVLRLKCSAQPLPRPRLFLAAPALPLSIACYL
jgi:hypothetical protein